MRLAWYPFINTFNIVWHLICALTLYSIVFIFRVKLGKKKKFILVKAQQSFQNVRNDSLNDTASHPRRLESLTSLQWERDISHVLLQVTNKFSKSICSHVSFYEVVSHPLHGPLTRVECMYLFNTTLFSGKGIYSFSFFHFHLFRVR